MVSLCCKGVLYYLICIRQEGKVWLIWLAVVVWEACDSLPDLCYVFSSKISFYLCLSRCVVRTMMLTQRLSVLAHDLAKQCQVSGPAKSEGRQRERKKSNHSLESEGSGESESFFYFSTICDWLLDMVSVM